MTNTYVIKTSKSAHLDRLGTAASSSSIFVAELQCKVGASQLQYTGLRMSAMRLRVGVVGPSGRGDEDDVFIAALCECTLGLIPVEEIVGT